MALTHQDAWREWRGAMAGPRMHHAWMLAGRRGVGKIDFAIAAARELVAEAGVRQPDEHPDVIVLTHLPANAEEEKKKAEGKPWQPRRNISVEQIREVQHRLITRPTLGARRAIIVFPADDLEKGAANALLKSLEEPPQGTFFLLVTHRPGRLLPTIRSRCRIVRFEDASAADVAASIERELPETDESLRQFAVEVANGSPKAAIDFIEQKLAPMYQVMVQLLRQGDTNFGLRGELADAIGQRPTRERQLATIELARTAVAHEMRRAERSSIPSIVHAYTELNRLAGQAPTYNFDPGLLAMEIGGLLASAAPPRERADG